MSNTADFLEQHRQFERFMVDQAAWFRKHAREETRLSWLLLGASALIYAGTLWGWLAQQSVPFEPWLSFAVLAMSGLQRRDARRSLIAARDCDQARHQAHLHAVEVMGGDVRPWPHLVS